MDPGPRSLATGTMLDAKYRIDRLIAVGGMGAVYAGTHIQLRKRVAIKILNPQLSSPAMIERFHREAITASQIGHEGIAQVTDLGISGDGEPFLVMEYLEGESLASRLRAAGPLAIPDACEIGCAILSPLEAAHRAGIVHRDLKPDNVFLVRQSRGETVKLLDFGISRAAGLEGEFRLTTTGLVLGTPFYMSPEQARGDSEVTPAADLYAFGVMLYEMLVGHVPIQAENYNQLMYRVMTGDYAPPRTHRPDLPESLEQLILQAMALEPVHRPPSAFELERALLVFCRPAVREQASGSLSSPRLAPPQPSGPALAQPSGPSGPSGQAGGVFITSAPTLPTGPHAAGAVSGPAPAVPVSGPARRSRTGWFVGVGAVALIGIVAAVAVSAGSGGAGGSGGASIAPSAAPTAARAGEPGQAAAVASGSGSASPAAAAGATAGSAAGATAGASAGPSAGSASGSATAQAVADATVTLRFAVDPASAVILVDGVAVRNNQLEVAKDAAAHTLRITAPGHVAHDETIRFDENQRLVVQLPRASEPHTRDSKPGRRDHPTDERIDSESPYR